MGCQIQAPITILRCPPLKVYSDAESRAIGVARQRARAAIPRDILLGLSDDYLLLRDQCRALENR